MHYHDSDDHKHGGRLRKAAKDSVDAFIAFDGAVFAEGDDRLELKTRELIAIGVAATTQCPYCMEAHVSQAKAAGATESDVAEAVMVAAGLRAGAAFTHGWMAMKMYNNAE